MRQERRHATSGTEDRRAQPRLEPQAREELLLSGLQPPLVISRSRAPTHPRLRSAARKSPVRQASTAAAGAVHRPKWLAGNCNIWFLQSQYCLVTPSVAETSHVGDATIIMPSLFVCCLRKRERSMSHISRTLLSSVESSAVPF